MSQPVDCPRSWLGEHHDRDEHEHGHGHHDTNLRATYLHVLAELPQLAHVTVEVNPA